MTVKYNTNENYVYDGKLDLVTAALEGNGYQAGLQVYLQCDAPACGVRAGNILHSHGGSSYGNGQMEGIEMDNYAMADLAYGVERCDLKIAGVTRTSMPQPSAGLIY